MQYDAVVDDIYPVLEQLRPAVIISAIRGDFYAQVEAHNQLVAYAQESSAFLVFLSSSNVFDAFTNFPSYENDKTFSESAYGKLKIQCENLIMRHLPEEQFAIIRLPMVFGRNSPRVREIKQTVLLEATLEVFPHLIINTTTDKKLSQQVHYIINRKRFGIFHLGSNDLIHHQELVREIVEKLNLGIDPHYKLVYTSNFDRYLAVLPKDNKLPKHLRITNEDVVAECYTM